MVSLVLAIICSALISIFISLSKNYTKNEAVMYAANYASCIMLALCYMKDISELSVLTENSGRVTLVIGVITGVLYLLNLVYMRFSIIRNGMVMSSTFSKLGVVVSILISILAFGEMPTSMQVVGMLLAIGAIVLINFDKKESIGKGNLVFLLLLLVMTGITDSMSSIFEKMGDASQGNGYLFTTFGTALVIAIVMAAVRKQKITKYDILFGVLIGIPNYFSSRLLLAALAQIDAVLVYPIYKIGTLVIITVTGIGLFKEKTSAQKICALGLIFFALILLNM